MPVILSIAFQDFINFYDLFVIILVSFIGSLFKLAHYQKHKNTSFGQVFVDVLFGTIVGFIVGHQLLFYELSVPIILCGSLISSIVSIKSMDLLLNHVPEIFNYFLDKFFKKK